MSKTELDFCSFLPMGNSGVGKSTFLNLIRGIQMLKTSSTGRSCTKEVTGIEFQLDDLLLTLIDPPGSGDTDGDDQKNNTKLIDFLKRLEHGLNAVAIVISASDHRIHQNLKNSLKFLYRFFGDGNFWFHVCVVVTHCPAYPEDIDELKISMTTGEDSLKSEMLNLIQNVCNLDNYPEIPFFFFDSKHPNNSPTKESLPEFIKWLKQCGPFLTQNLEVKDFKWQYQELRQEDVILTGPMKPIFELIPGEPKMITIEEDFTYTEKEKKVHQVKRTIEKWVDREWDALDKWLIGIPRLFRKNKVKETHVIVENIEYEENVIKYRKEQKTIFSGKCGENQKQLVGYYQEIMTFTESYTACWPYDCNDDDIRNRTNPLKIDLTRSEETLLKINYFDANEGELSPINKVNEIKKLESIISCK